MKPFYFLALVGTALTFGNAGASPTSTPVASQGETLVVATSGYFAVQVKIKTHEVDIGKPSDPRPVVIESSCTYSRYPCSIVDRIDITINGQPLSVPRSVFCDLADLNDAEIKIGRKGAILRLGGGDASESYIVYVEFDTTLVMRRVLYSSTDQRHPLQKTNYYLVVEGN